MHVRIRSIVIFNFGNGIFSPCGVVVPLRPLLVACSAVMDRSPLPVASATVVSLLEGRAQNADAAAKAATAVANAEGDPAVGNSGGGAPAGGSQRTVISTLMNTFSGSSAKRTDPVESTPTQAAPTGKLPAGVVASVAPSGTMWL